MQSPVPLQPFPVTTKTLCMMRIVETKSYGRDLAFDAAFLPHSTLSQLNKANLRWIDEHDCSANRRPAEDAQQAILSIYERRCSSSIPATSPRQGPTGETRQHLPHSSSVPRKKFPRIARRRLSVRIPRSVADSNGALVFDTKGWTRLLLADASQWLGTYRWRPQWPMTTCPRSASQQKWMRRVRLSESLTPILRCCHISTNLPL